MSKAVLISIKPEWCEKIASGEKTIEVRKTRPKLPTPFKCYIYCTRGEYLWLAQSGNVMTDKAYNRILDDLPVLLNGKVIGEFVCDNVLDVFISISNPKMIKKAYPFPGTGLTDLEIMSYLGNGCYGYGWHISDLKIYDTPISLGEFHHCGENYHFNPPITRPPQNWCYVEELT